MRINYFHGFYSCMVISVMVGGLGLGGRWMQGRRRDRSGRLVGKKGMVGGVVIFYLDS